MAIQVTPIQRIGSKLRLLAQTKLPLEVTYLELDDYREIIAAIKHLDVRGAPAIGIAAAYGIAVAVEHANNTSLEFVSKIAEEFKDARPTAVNLFWAVDRMVKRLSKIQSDIPEERLKFLWDEAKAIHDEDRDMCDRIGKYGAELIKDGDSILTHCNAGALATGGIGTATAIMYVCHDQGKKIKVYADETRPLLQGARLTTWELQQVGIDVTLICDNMAGMLMKQGKIDHVIVGTDRIARNGDFANKIGTYSVAVLAQYHGVPFYVTAPSTTFDDNTATGKDIVIEMRSPEEITEGFGRRTAPEGISVYSPAFDVTPYELVTSYITDKGIKNGGRE